MRSLFTASWLQGLKNKDVGHNVRALTFLSLGANQEKARSFLDNPGMTLSEVLLSLK